MEDQEILQDGNEDVQTDTVQVETVGWTQTMNDAQLMELGFNLAIVMIFILGIIAGLISARIMWGRIKV